LNFKRGALLFIILGFVLATTVLPFQVNADPVPNQPLGDPIDNPEPLGDPIDNPEPLGDPIDNPEPL
jgi:hypothetical protein